jgi:RNA recognition motif-containing protein
MNYSRPSPLVHSLSLSLSLSLSRSLVQVGDIPDADVKPPDNVLFVCKLNPVTTDDDLRLIFSRYGKILSVRARVCTSV